MTKRNRVTAGSIRGLVRALSDSALNSARTLDAVNGENRKRFEEACAQAGLSPSDPALALCQPPELSISSVRVEAAMRVTERSSTQVDVGLRLGAQLVHSFFQARYGRENSRYDRIAIEFHRSPVPPGVNQTTEE